MTDVKQQEAPAAKDAAVDAPTHPALDDTKSFDIVRTFSAKSNELNEAIAHKKDGEKKPVKDGEIDIEEHLMTIEETTSLHKVNVASGLKAADAAQRLEQYGPNRLTPPPQENECIKFTRHLTGFFALLLWAGGILCFISYSLDNESQDNLYLGVVLVIVVFLTGCFSYYQDSKSAKIMNGFNNFLPEMTVCIRDGKKFEVAALDLTRGDIVFMKAGDKIPADVRLLEATNFRVDNSSLTGESEPQKRAIINKHENPLEAVNLAFYGTMCTEGSAKGVIIRTGDDTVIGKIAALTAGASDEMTPIAHEIHHFITFISVVAITLGITFLIIGLAKGQDPVQSLVFMIGIIVANVPEGLLATVTVSLTLTAQRMASKNVLVKNLESVETLGSTTVIASDKTGTLTQNRMTVAHVYYDEKIRVATAQGDAKVGYNTEDGTFKMLQNVGTLCNNAVFIQDDENDALPILQRKTDGDASESAFIKFFHPMHDINKKRTENTKLAEVPFKSANKYQISVHLNNNDQGADRLLVMKGAPERVWARCSTIMIDGESVEKTTTNETHFLDAQRVLMSGGERVLGCAMTVLPCEKFGKDFEYNTDDEDINFPVDNLTFVGLVSLIDPPRVTVPDAVRNCQTAGIKVIMVTGDHPDTAEAIAKQVSIIRGRTRRDLALEAKCDMKDIDKNDARIEATVVTGSELAELTDEQLDAVLDFDQIVFARTSPAQKLQIVKGLQEKKFIRRHGKEPVRVQHIVAVTGDGVNDSPALKKANIGVAMGITGSDVAKEAADMILLDDNFASIVRGVEEGRLIFDNLKKSIAYTLSSNIPEITPFLFFILLDIPLPLETVLILCIDLGTDMVPAISLAYERKEADIMKKPPRDAAIDRLVTNKLISFAYLQIGIIQATAGFFTYFIVMNDYGFSPGLLLGNGTDWKVSSVEGTTLVGKDGAEITGDNSVSDCNIGSPDDDSSPCHDPPLALAHAQTAFFVSIVVVQWADLLICKTRMLSIKQQGMSNGMLNFGLLSETILSVCLVYIPFLNTLGTEPLAFVHWLPALPFMMIIFLYDEFRKYLLRLWGKESWLYKNTYY